MKNYQKNTALVLASTLLTLFMLELALRFLYPQPLLNITTQSKPYIKYDPQLGWANRENTSFADTAGNNGNATLVQINSQGLRSHSLRGKGFTLEKTPGVKRVIVIGDSITFGYGLNIEDTYPHLLGQMLGEGYEVLNAGVTGFGLDQQYLFFKRDLVSYKPDILVVGFSAGDIYDSTCSVRFGVGKPFFTLTSGQLKLNNTPVPQKASIREALLASRPLAAFFLKQSHLFRLAFSRLADMEQLLDMDIKQMDTIEGAKVSREIISQLRKECRDIGCETLFLAIPMQTWISASISKKNAELLSRGHRAAMRILKQTGVPYIDLWGPFVNNFSDGLFLKGDPLHPNPRGNALIAGEIHRHLTGQSTQDNTQKALSLTIDAEAAQAKGKPDKAEALYREAISLDPTLARAMLGLGSVLGGKGLIDEAIVLFEQAASLEPTNPLPHYNLSIAYGIKGMRIEAIKANAVFKALGGTPPQGQ